MTTGTELPERLPSFQECERDQTVAQCQAYQNNGVYTAANDGKFFYGGGHMQKHATLLGLGGMNNALLSEEIRSQLGADVTLSYSQPQLAGGVFMSSSSYAFALRKMLAGQLLMGSMLGAHLVCTNRLTCTAAVIAPIPLEKLALLDRTLGRGRSRRSEMALSAAPARSASTPGSTLRKTYYGVLARLAAGGALDRSIAVG